MTQTDTLPEHMGRMELMREVYRLRWALHLVAEADMEPLSPIAAKALDGRDSPLRSRPEREDSRA